MSCVPVGQEQAVFDINNPFDVLGASEDLEDTPKVSTSAATLSTEDYVSFYPNLDRVLIEAIRSSHETPGDIIEKLDEMWAEAEFQQQDAEEAAASLVGLEDKPKAPTCAGTVEKMVSSLEAKIEVQEPKLLDIEDKPKAPTSAATVTKVVSSLDFIGLEAKIELQEPNLLDIEDKADTTLKVP